MRIDLNILSQLFFQETLELNVIFEFKMLISQTETWKSRKSYVKNSHVYTHREKYHHTKSVF